MLCSKHFETAWAKISPTTQHTQHYTTSGTRSCNRAGYSTFTTDRWVHIHWIPEKGHLHQCYQLLWSEEIGSWTETTPNWWTSNWSNSQGLHWKASDNSELQTAYQKGTATVDNNSFKMSRFQGRRRGNRNRSSSHSGSRDHKNLTSKCKRCGFTKHTTSDGSCPPFIGDLWILQEHGPLWISLH